MATKTKEKELIRDLPPLDFMDTNNVLKDVCYVIDSSLDSAYQAVNIALIKRNWLIGYRIAKEELKGEKRANYGKEIIKDLAQKLTEKYGKGFTKTNLYSFYNFYKLYPNIFHSLSNVNNLRTRKSSFNVR